MSTKKCIRCKTKTERTYKKGFLKFVGRFIKVHSYKCQNPECGYEQLVFPKIYKTLLPVIAAFLVSLLLFLIVVVFFVPGRSPQGFQQIPEPRPTPNVTDIQ